MADPPADPLVESCAIIHNNDSLSLVALALPLALILAWIVLCLFIVIHVHCSRTAELRIALRLAKKELHIVKQASMDVSTVHLFPSDTTFDSLLWALQILTTVIPTRKEEHSLPQLHRDHHRHLLIHLLQRIRSPCSFCVEYQEHRLHVLGCALWFRLHVHQELFTTEALEDLLASRPWHDKVNGNNTTVLGLSFMNETLLWAVLPLDRPMIRYCLGALAWAMRAPNQFASFHQRQAVGSHSISLPGEVITLLLDCILQSYKDTRARQRTDECEGLLPPQYAEPNDKDMPIFQYPQAMRVSGYLHLLGVFLSDDTDNYSEGLGEDDHDKNDRAKPPVSYFSLRPGILEEHKVPPPNCALWIKTFATRLLANVNYCSSSSSSFLCQNLPFLLIHLGCYAQASQLLHANQNFATDRWQMMGLKTTVEAFVLEWEWLDHCMRQALLVPESMRDNSPTSQWLCEQTLSIAARELDPSTRCCSCLQEVAKACYRMGIFAVHHQQSVGNYQAKRLLQDGRRLQVLVLEARCRMLAKSIQNLGITLHIREAVQAKKKNKTGATSRTESNPESTLRATKCFVVSKMLVDSIVQTCQDHKDRITDTTIVEVATCLCKALLQGRRELHPFFHAVAPDPTDGVGFRTKRLIHHWHKSKEASHLFADFQVALCSHLPCTEAQSTGTTNFLKALSYIDGIK
jgi:hypothetical protein